MTATTDLNPYVRLSSSEDREAWLEARRQGVTATDVARLATGGPAVWATVAAEKAGHDSFTGNQYTRHGTEREPVIAERVCNVYPLVPNTDLLQSTADPRWLATPDLIDPFGSMIGEIKTAVWKGSRWKKPPRNYELQCQWQLHVTGAAEAILAVEYHDEFVPKPNLQFFHLTRDDKRIAELVDIAEKFLAQEPNFLDLLLADYARIESQEAAIKAEKDALVELIRKEIGDRDQFKHVSDLGSINLSTPKPRESFDSARFKADHPDTYEQYVKTTQTKPSLLITTVKENS